jgi:hypothetical protein
MMSMKAKTESCVDDFDNIAMRGDKTAQINPGEGKEAERMLDQIESMIRAKNEGKMDEMNLCKRSVIAPVDISHHLLARRGWELEYERTFFASSSAHNDNDDGMSLAMFYTTFDNVFDQDWSSANNKLTELTDTLVRTYEEKRNHVSPRLKKEYLDMRTAKKKADSSLASSACLNILRRRNILPRLSMQHLIQLLCAFAALQGCQEGCQILLHKRANDVFYPDFPRNLYDAKALIWACVVLGSPEMHSLLCRSAFCSLHEEKPSALADTRLKHYYQHLRIEYVRLPRADDRYFSQ